MVCCSNWCPSSKVLGSLCLTLFVLDSVTISYLIVPPLDWWHCILDAKSQVNNFSYLQGQGTCVTPVHAKPGHFLWEMTLGDVGWLVGVWHIPEPKDYGVRECLPDTGQVLPHLSEAWLAQSLEQGRHWTPAWAGASPSCRPSMSLRSRWPGPSSTWSISAWRPPSHNLV